MTYIVKEIRSEPTAQIARDLNRDYEAALDFVHKVQDVSGDIDEFGLYDVCEADEDIAEYGDGSVILCTDDYTIYDDIENKEGVDGYLAVTHSDTFVVGDAHTNMVRTAIASFASGWRSSVVSRSITSRNTPTSSN